VIVASQSTPTNYMIGIITSFSGTFLNLNVLSSGGSGTNISPWNFSIIGAPGPTGPTGPDGPTGPTGANAVATGPAGAVQYTDGSGSFLGNDGLVYNGTESLVNAINSNFIAFDNGSGDMSIGASKSLILYAGNNIVPGYVDIFTGQLTFANQAGATGQYATSQGPDTAVIWTNPSVPSGTSLINAVSPIPVSTYWIQVNNSFITDVNAPITATLQLPEGATQNWIVYAFPFFGTDSNWYIQVEFSAPVTTSGAVVSWAVNSLTSTQSTAVTTSP
jgi:hypothetical protein